MSSGGVQPHMPRNLSNGLRVDFVNVSKSSGNAFKTHVKLLPDALPQA